MADDVQANIGLNIDTSNALAGLKALQSELSAIHTQLSKLGPAQRASAAIAQRALVDNINATGKFAASMTTVRTTAESFTHALEKNKLTMGEYFRYAGGASKSFGKMFAREFATIEKVAIERVKTLQTQYVKLGRDANGAMKAIQVRPLVLDMNDLQTKTAVAAQKQQILNQLLKQGSTAMLNWGKNTQWAGRQLMVGFSIPIGIFAGKAMQAFSDLEKQVISFKRVYGDLGTTAKETDAMAESIKNLALEFTKYGVSVSNTMDMASKAAAMGKTGADLIAQVQQANKLSVLGQVDQQKALETTISLTNAFGTSSQDLGKKINFLNAVENQTVLSIEDMTTAIPKAGPVVKQLGGNVEDLAFFLTAMKEGGINASEGANALKSGLASMINPTKKASDMLKGFGIDLNAIVKKDKGNVRQTVIDFAKALDKLDPLNRAKAIEQLFGKFQFARISTLMKNAASDSSQAAKTAQLAQQSSIELAAMSAREMRKISSSPLYQFQKALQDFQAQLAPIGEQFMKFVTPIIDWVNGILKSFNSLGDGTKQFIVGFTSVVAGLGPILLMTFGLIANGFANIIKGFAAVKSIFNKTQTASEILGQETSYMTEEQMKAKAVAASLDQVHGKLIQTFNVETGAVNSLAAAYERAVVASSSLLPGKIATGTRSTPKTKKLAGGGILSGPGTGTSDSIPAMLSNGEAVIPAKAVSRNPHLVQSLIDGTINKFAGGYNPYAIKSTAQKAKEEADWLAFKASTEKAKQEAAAQAEAKRASKSDPAAMKRRMDPAFLYNPAISGPLTPDSPVAKRMIRDQHVGPIYFATMENPVSFSVGKEIRMLRDMGLKANSFRTIFPSKIDTLGKNYRVMEYGPNGKIVRFLKDGGIVGKMLNRSTVATRIPMETLIQMLSSGDTRYRSAFETQSGADFLTKNGLRDEKGENIRRRMESDIFGIPFSAGANGRPTYGSVATASPMARLLNRLFGGKMAGKQFNQVTNPMSDKLNIYGDTSLIGKRSIGKRSSIYNGDIFVDYKRDTARASTLKNFVRSMYGNENVSTSLEKALFNEMGKSHQYPDNPNAYWTNPKLPHIEAYTSGGFDLNEVKKIITKNPEMIPVLKEALKKQGLNIPVRGQRTGLLGKIFGFAKGGMVNGPGNGTSDSIPAMVSNGEFIMPAKQTRKYRPLLDAMSSNRLPGFNGKNGNVVGEKKRQSKRNKENPTNIINLFRNKTRSAPKGGGSLSFAKQGSQMSWGEFENENKIVAQAALEHLIQSGMDPKEAAEIVRKKYTGIDLAHTNPKYQTRTIAGRSFEEKLWTAAPGDVTPDLRAFNQFFADRVEKTVGTPGKTYKTGSLIGDILKDDKRLEHIAQNSGLSKPQVVKELRKFKSGRYPQPNDKQAWQALRGFAAGESGAGAAATVAGIDARLKNWGSAGSHGAAAKAGKFKFNQEAERLAKKEFDDLAKRYEQEILAMEGEKKNTEVTRTRRKKANETIVASTESQAKSAKEIAKQNLQEARAARTNGEKLTRAQKKILAEYDAQRAAINAKTKATKEANKRNATQSGYIVSGVDQYVIDASGNRKQPGRFAKAVSSAKGKLGSIFSMGQAARAARGAKAESLLGGMTGGKMFGAGMGVSLVGNMIGGAVGGDTGSTISAASDIASTGMMMFGKQLLPIITKLGVGFAKFLPVIGLATTAFSVLYGVIDLATKAQREHTKSLQDRATSTSVSQTTMSALADFFGSTTITDKYFASPMPTTSTNGIGLVVDELRKNQGFQAAYKDQKWGEALKSGNDVSNRDLLNSIAIRLGADLSKPAVEAIILAIQKEAGVNTLALDFKSIDIKTKKGRKGILSNIQEAISKASSEPQSLYESNQKKIAPLQSKLTEEKQKLATAEETLKNAQPGSIAETTAFNQKQSSMQQIADITEQISRYKSVTNQSADITSLNTDVANRQSNALIALGAAYQKGDIDIKQYMQTSKDLQTTFMGYVNSSTRGKEALDLLIDSNKNWNIEDKKTAHSLRSTKDAYNLFAASVFYGSKAMELARKIQGLQEAADKSSGIERKRYNDEIERTSNLLSALAGKKPPKILDKLTPNNDPFGTGKDTLNKTQQARQKKWQDAMSLINMQEDKVNKKYEDRIAALDKVNQLNQEIAASQKDQLDLADALSKGDIAAAARAAQTMRANDSQREYEKQKQALEQAQQNEINALNVLVNGKYYTKDQIQGNLDYYEKKSLTNSLKNNTVQFNAMGGLIKPRYFAAGDLARGTDIVPAMLTPGEFIMTRSAVQNFGVDNLRAINAGVSTASTSRSDSVYNYSINVNVSSNANANDIAKTVMTQIKRIDSQRVRGV